jgi:alpha-glucosidase
MNLKLIVSVTALALPSFVFAGGGSPAQATGPANGDVVGNANTTSKTAGGFQIQWTSSEQLRVLSAGREIWASRSGKSFVRGARHSLSGHENRGSFLIDENVSAVCDIQTVDSISRSWSGVVTVSGDISGGDNCSSAYTLRFEQEQYGHLKYSIDFANINVNYSELAYSSTSDERFHGFGEQFSVLNLKGKTVPVLSEEGGVGRGHTPITQLVNTGSNGSGGNELTTYYAVPQYITNTNKSLFLENTDYSVFDLSADNEVRVRLFSGDMHGRILFGNSMLDLIERFTDYTGRMRALPDWFNEGAIVGMQGGTDKVTAVLNELKQRGTPIGGFWLQDWVGKRQTSFGSQLWWNWELDNDRYPNWNGLVDSIEAEGGKMLCYINPFLVDATEKGNVQRNLYQEAVLNNYMVKKTNGSIYAVTNTDFDAGMVDLTNPNAVNWIKNVIKDELITKGRCHGWMHDFAEALPLDAVLHSGVSAAQYHNQYPVDWARIGREAITEAGYGDDIVFFNRSGAAKTPTYSTLLWQGDQLVTWDKYDGMKTSIMALLSGGFSGISLNHSDIGGYTNATLGGIGYNREEELLLRWMELSAFTAAYRTHEGLKPADNAQFYDNDTTYDQFDKFARVYKALAFYRSQLMVDAQTKGHPLVRHPMLHYPNDNELATLTDHMMLGSEILVAPIVNKKTYNQDWKKVYFPEGNNTTWVNIFTGDKYGKNGNTSAPLWLSLLNPASGNYEWVYAPIGSPAAFYKQGSAVGAQLEQNLITLGVK